jgi:superfamily I DNA/RNA helicase
VRFPSLNDLDREQRRIYAEAPNDGAILVVGPPGTGKTVMAFHRAHKLKELGQTPHVIMFNRVLRQYTSTRSGVAPDIPVSTMNSWVETWWRRGARARVPKELNERFVINWTEMTAQGAALLAKGHPAEQLSWGHLLVDEGQDFPASMYLTLGTLQQLMQAQAVPTQLTIFADDNQRLNANQNCRVVDIRRHLFLEGAANRNFKLSKNFRNTLEIAEFSAFYQVGNESGVAELPERRGELPQVVFAPSDRDVADFIVRKSKLSPGSDIGVIVCGGRRLVSRAFNQIGMRAKQGHTNVRVQMYLSKDDNHKAEDLKFDQGNSITVLHMNSAKGLEFDVVFFLGMEGMKVETSGFLNERMALYVMCSRARSELYLVFANLDLGADLPAAANLLPPIEMNLCRYVGLSTYSAIMPQLAGLLDTSQRPPEEVQ